MAKRRKIGSVEFWTKEVANQKKWIEDCGGDLQGYIAKYGDPGVPKANGKKMSGDGGTAIYNADLAGLKRAEAFLEQARYNQREKAKRS